MTEDRAAELPLCDLVMKGGITSGVIYPKLIAQLARDYRFKSIGGTSAGAIAAAGCAAAEHGRQQGTNADAFEQLAQLPRELGGSHGTPERSRLFHLFQPHAALRRHFAVLTGSLCAATPSVAAAGFLKSLLVAFWSGPLLALGIAMLLIAPALVAAQQSLPAAVLASLSIVAALALAAGLAVAFALWRFGASLLRGLHGNFYGVCSGATMDGAPDAVPAEGLTDWLAGYFNRLAGLDPAGPPLTFGDLWDGRAAPRPEENADETPLAARAINLQVMTTAVSQQMCYAIPLRDGAEAFYYDPAEWARLFPSVVMAWLARVAAAQEAWDGEPPIHSAQGLRLRRLPGGRHLPVVVAVRMSLSFPVLLSAIPLYACDHSRKDPALQRVAKRVWFSDGGIASNMPLHFFDAPLPAHPTFAINLKDQHPDYPIDPARGACAQEGRVYLPTGNSAGRQRFWKAPPDTSPLGIAGFMWSVVLTMQNWRDEIQFPYPGYRDRIIQISQQPDEGGLNLDMPVARIDALGDAGECAAQQLSARFHPGSTAPDRGGWENHEQIRLRTFLGIVEELATHRCVSDPRWDEVVDRAQAARQFTQAEAQLAHAVLAALRRLGADIGESGVSLVAGAPKPRPTMRIAPRI